MPWVCGNCNRAEGKNGSSGEIKIEAVCHHCGRPLCQDDRFQVEDDAFGYKGAGGESYASHCLECAKQYHPRAERIGGRNAA